MKEKKLELICEKLLKKIEETNLNEYKPFYGCKNVEDVLLAIGTEVWGNVLYEVGYSPKFYITEVINQSPRFCKLFDRVLAKLEKNEEKVMKMTNYDCSNKGILI